MVISQRSIVITNRYNMCQTVTIRYRDWSMVNRLDEDLQMMGAVRKQPYFSLQLTNND